MPHRFPPRIPDADGAAHPELREAWRRIDRQPGLLLITGARRTFRAAAAYDLGGDMELYQSLGFAVAEIASELRMTDSDVRRLLLSGKGCAIADAIKLFRP